jgi:hypothetical protein
MLFAMASSGGDEILERGQIEFDNCRVIVPWPALLAAISSDPSHMDVLTRCPHG